MGERMGYVPPEAKKPKTERFKAPKRGEALFAKLALAAAIFGAAPEAMAAQQQKTAAVEKAESKNVEKQKGQLKASGHDFKVTYLGQKEGKDTVTLVVLRDEGNPMIEGDEYEIKQFVLNGPKGQESKLEVNGTTSPLKHDIKQITGFPESIRKAADPTAERDMANLDLAAIEQQMLAIKGFESVGKGDTEAAAIVKTQLLDDVMKFKKAHPDVPLPDDEIKKLIK